MFSFFDLIVVCFRGDDWEEAMITQLAHGKDGEKVFIEKTIKNNLSNDAYQNTKRKLICIEGDAKIKFKDIQGLLPQLTESKSLGGYISLPDYKLSLKILKYYSKHAGYAAEIFGIDPDYFITLVPLRQNNTRNIQMYVLGLKQKTDFASKIKYFLKRMLINAGVWYPLYERFVVLVHPKDN